MLLLLFQVFVFFMLKYKWWYYETAIADGREERVGTMLPTRLPPEIQKL